MTTQPLEDKGPKVPQSYPPKTPPPPKRPVEPPRPQPGAKPAASGMPDARMLIRNRQSASLTFRADEWAARKAVHRTLETVAAWGHRNLDPGDLVTAVRLLIEEAVAGGGKRISVHLADRGEQLMVTALSHLPDGEAGVSPVLAEVAALATVGECGTDVGPDGLQVWVVLGPVRHRGAVA